MNNGSSLREKSVPDTRRGLFGATPPDVALPKGACDCHLHVFGPDQRYPFADERAYTPMDALPADAASVLGQIGLDRVVLVQPSVYGIDNSCLLNAMDELPFPCRGVVAIGPETTKKSMNRMHDKGIRGIRLNGTRWSAEELEGRVRQLDPMIHAMTALGWHVEAYIGSHAYPALDKISKRYKIDIVLDHFGGVFSPNETIAERIEAIKRLKGLGNVWMKLSGIYRVWNTSEDPRLGKELLHFMAGTIPDRLLWGSDWPHTPHHTYGRSLKSDPQAFRNIDAGLLLSDFLEGVADPRTAHRILVDNPNSLYQF